MSHRFDGSRVAICGINYAPERTGIGPYTTSLAETLAVAGAEVHTVTGVPHYPNWRVDDGYRHALIRREELNGVQLTRVRHVVPRSNSLAGRAAMEASFASAATAALLRLKFDALIAVTPSLGAVAAAIAAKRGRPLGVHVQDLTGEGAAQSGTTSGTVGTRIAAMEYALLRRAQLVGVISNGFTASLTDNGVDAQRIVDVPNFSRVTASPLDRHEARRSLGWSLQRPTVVHTGNMGMKQGLEAVVDAARAMPDVDFKLIGAGNQHAELLSRAAGLANVEFVPPVDDAVYPAVLSAADVLVVSERAGVGTMSLPSKLTSYVVAGRPILAAVEPDGLTARVVRRDGIARIVAPSDTPAFVGGVRRLLGDEGLRQRLVAAQATARERMNSDTARSRYVAFAERLLSVGAG